MKQPALFDVPKGDSMRDRINAFKTEQRIWTHRTSQMKRQDHPWCAMLLPRGDVRHPVAIIAAECALLDESGQLVTGEGELSAIRTLCIKNGIPCPL